jgi:DNA polymerase III sliding clamp (beta) subunit (PCNA family)
MQIKVDKLREVMKLLEPAVPKKTALPVLHNVLIKDGKAIAGDMETFVMIDLPEADIDCLIPHRPVMQLLKYVPGPETLTIEANKELNFTWDGGNASYPLVKVKDYPVIREITAKVQGTMDGNLLINALTSVALYCSHDEARPVLSGVAIFPGENLDIAAGDGFRMAYQTISASFPIEQPLIIPSGAVWLINSLWRHTTPDAVAGETLVERVLSKRQIDITFAEGEKGPPDKLQLCFSNVTVQSILIQGTPPNFKQLIPSDIPTKVQFFPSDLERALKRLSAIARDGSGIIKLKWTKDTMTVSAKSEEMGKTEGTLPVQADNPGAVALDISYLLQYLGGKEGLITMGITAKTAPVVFRHRLSPLILVMPMNVQQ